MSRLFPNPSQTEQRDFIIHSCRLEGINMDEDIITSAMSEGAEGNPHATGHFSACNLVVTNAHREDVLPLRSAMPSEQSIRDKRAIFFKLHRALMEPLAVNGPRLLGSNQLELYEVGTLRRSEKKLGDRIMPSPGAVPHLLDELIVDVGSFHQQWYEKLNAANIAWEEVGQLSNAAWQFHLRFICIKPFQDGTNRVARLFLNLMRLNWGLPWYIPSAEETKKREYLAEIWRVQDAMDATN